MKYVGILFDMNGMGNQWDLIGYSKDRRRTSDLWTDAAVVRAFREQKGQKSKRQKRKTQWREDQGARKGRQVAQH